MLIIIEICSVSHVVPALDSRLETGTICKVILHAYLHWMTCMLKYIENLYARPTT